jgi:hypothetical protein
MRSALGDRRIFRLCAAPSQLPALRGESGIRPMGQGQAHLDERFYASIFVFYVIP